MRGILFMLLCVGLAGCASTAEIREVSMLNPIVPKSGKSKPVMFKKIIVDVKRGKDIGSIQTGMFCVPAGELYWRSGRAVISDEEFGDILRRELEKSNYTVVGDPSQLFEDESSWKAEYLIAGRVTDINANICYPAAGFGNFNSAKGEGYMEVEWQIYSRKNRDVVLKIKTEGTSKINAAVPSGDDEIYYQAFAMAVNNLLAKQEFYELVALDKEVVKEGENKDLSPIKIKYKNIAEMKSQEEVEKDKIIERMRGSVVTIFAGEGHGSGFLISEDGYILTNEHVVSGATFVQVKFVTGREVTGEVVRKDKIRDVALLKLEKDVYPFLYLGDSSKIDIGEEAYAIGTPLLEDLSQTVSKGIVSSFRVIDDIRYIQSDVNINAGNSGGPLVSIDKGVVGICVSGVGFGPITLGLNYFVPIEEAIKSLKIEQDV